MKLLLFCALLAIANAEVIEPCNNDSIVLQNVVQEKRIIKTHVSSPYQFAIDHDTNTLFFSYTADKEEMFESVYLGLKDNSSGIIDGVASGFANAVDNKNKIVYIGGRDGIYKFDYETKTATNIGITNKSIWQLFFKDALYFTTYADEIAYVYKDGEVKPVPELVGISTTLVAFDNKNNILYHSGGQLYKIQDGSKVLIGKYNINAFSADVNGNLYFSTPYDIYSIKNNGEIVKITSLPYIYGFAIKSDNTIVYGDEQNIIELQPTDKKCYKINSSASELT